LNHSLHASSRIACCGLAAALMCTAAWAADAVSGQPDFMSQHAGWQLNDGDPGTAATDFHAVPGELTRPMSYDVKHPYAGNGDALKRKPFPRVGDITNPILQPWARDVIKATNDDVLNTGVFPFTAEQRCWPGGVPGLLLFPAEPVYYLQTPKEVWFMTQRDQEIRRIFLNVPHQANPGYSWYGDEVGHYVNGDTLAIDTIGLDDKGPVDNYRTPHTKQLHVIETHQVDAARSRVFVNITVEDPGAYTMPWKAWKIYGRVNPARQQEWLESICAENNADYFDERPVPLPHATKLDF